VLRTHIKSLKEQIMKKEAEEFLLEFLKLREYIDEYLLWFHPYPVPRIDGAIEPQLKTSKHIK